jgi:hypothetical protein
VLAGYDPASEETLLPWPVRFRRTARLERNDKHREVHHLGSVGRELSAGDPARGLFPKTPE